MPGDATDVPRRPARVAAALGLGIGLVLIGGIVGFAVRGGSSPATTAAGPGGTVPPATLPASTVDIGFAQDMLDHHDQAVLIANYAQAHASSPMVRSMAAAVIGSQRYEIGVLEQFLRDRGRERGDPDRTVMAWMGMPVPHAQMPGLQPDDVVVAYLNTSGTDVDRRFLELMLAHHEGGVHMATYAGDHADDPGLRALARRMAVDQQTEIGDYQSALGGLA